MNPVSSPFLRLVPGLFPALLALVLAVPGARAQQPGARPVKIFIMAGQSNMQGHGNMTPAATPGTLEHTVANDPAGDYQFVSDGGGWKTWNDVWIHYERSASTVRTGNLTAGFGSSDTTIGPEVGFGSVVGDHYSSQVLLIKTAWGGKSLAVDFRPPSSGGTTGFYYNEI
ncbi:MAG: hypothetical protein HKO57_10890, partial [Akkermansiaceae bacterium]|nr:hypothetical protein [Akkermansiaceae bacterium]